MTLHELESPEALQAFLQTHANALICFSATWCGPCRASKPTLEELASSYEKNPSLDVKVGIAYEHNLKEAIHQHSVSAFPTYILFQKASEVGRVRGVDFDGIKSMVEKAGCKKDLGEGHSLGGGGGYSAALSPEEARAQRLARFGAPAAAPIPAAKTTGDDEVKDVEMDEPADGQKDVEMSDAPPAQDDSTTDKKEKESEMVDPTASLSQSDLDTLTTSMGFTLIRAQKGLLNGGGTAEGAVEWLLQHQDDDDIDDPIPLVPKSAASSGGSEGASAGGVAQSFKCNECGKTLSNMANLELHANKTGHSDFEESTEKVKPLTAEEKAAKIAEIKNLLKTKRREREEAEKVDDIDREKQRRFMGKEMAKTKEQLEREQRKREALKRKKEKDEFRRERERIRAELAKDKAERQANKGKLHSSLGVEGYNPNAIQYDAPSGGGGGGGGGGAAPQQHKASKASTAKIDDYIKKVASYRAGGDGQKCLKILLAYVKNVVDKPDEEKFKTINMENKAFKTKVKPFVGAKSLLMAVGFSPSDDGDALILKEDADRKVLAETKGKLEAAYAAY